MSRCGVKNKVMMKGVYKRRILIETFKFDKKLLSGGLEQWEENIMKKILRRHLKFIKTDLWFKGGD